MDEIKLFLKENMKKIIFFLVFTVIIVPVGIHFLFKWNSGVSWLQAEWTAGEALTFYGTLLAAGIGAFGVFVSIQYAQKSYKEDARRQVLPYFAVIQLHGKSKYNALQDFFQSFQLGTLEKDKSEENPAPVDSGTRESAAEVIPELTTRQVPLYEETVMTRACFVLEENEIKCFSDLSEAQKTLLAKGGLHLESNAHGWTLEQIPYMSFPMYIENVGNGAAICTRIGFFKKDTKAEYLPPIQINKNGKFYVHVFSEVTPKKLIGEYVFSITYQDIYKHGYKQDFTFDVTQEGYSLSLDCEQIREV